ncbi:hypothetical protein, partial [Tannerella forsythia]|uniref:hypothetical protein n=1 Tax=Tannerella forsythia TaxID=28112 RepID=UPI001C8A969F
MRKIFFIVLSTISVIAYGQDKYNYVHFNELTEVVGTEYVIASIENKGKMFKTENDYLLFINQAAIYRNYFASLHHEQDRFPHIIRDRTICFSPSS